MLDQRAESASLPIKIIPAKSGRTIISEFGPGLGSVPHQKTQGSDSARSALCPPFAVVVGKAHAASVLGGAAVGHGAGS
jgi:hypothetical protein